MKTRQREKRKRCARMRQLHPLGFWIAPLLPRGMRSRWRGVSFNWRGAASRRLRAADGTPPGHVFARCVCCGTLQRDGQRPAAGADAATGAPGRCECAFQHQAARPHAGIGWHSGRRGASSGAELSWVSDVLEAGGPPGQRKGKGSIVNFGRVTKGQAEVMPEGREGTRPVTNRSRPRATALLARLSTCAGQAAVTAAEGPRRRT